MPSDLSELSTSEECFQTLHTDVTAVRRWTLDKGGDCVHKRLELADGESSRGSTGETVNVIR